MICKKWFRQDEETVLCDAINKLFFSSNKVLFFALKHYTNKTMHNFVIKLQQIEVVSGKDIFWNLIYLHFQRQKFAHICFLIQNLTSYSKHKFYRYYCIIVHNMIKYLHTENDLFEK